MAVRSVPGAPGFVLYFSTEFPDSFYADFFVVLLTAIDGKQEIGDQPEVFGPLTILASGNQMVDSEVAFPPSKEYLYVPSELVNKSNLLCC